MVKEKTSPNIVRELQRTRNFRKKEHLENIQLSLAVLIIGSYFTEVGQELTTINEVGWLTNIFVGVSVFYIIAKTIELTVRQFSDHRILALFGAGTYTIYTISAASYAFFLAIVLFEIPVTELATYAIVGLIVIFSLLSGVIVYAVNIIELLEMFPGVDERKVSPYVGVFLADLVTSFPETLEEGMELVGREVQVQDGGVDAMMVDSDDKTVAVEFKYRIKDLVPSDILEFEEKVEAERYVVAVNSKANVKNIEEFQGRGIEVITVDPYTAFGILSEPMAFIDRHLGIFGFQDLGLA